MIHGEPINPAGTRQNNPPARGTFTNKFIRFIKRGRNLFHTAPAAIHGDSGKVMDRCMKYHRQQSGAKR